MSEQVLSNAMIMYEGVDLSSQLNQVVIDLSAEPLDRTALSDSTRRRVGGLKTAAISAAGFFNAEQPDATLFPDAGGGDKLITIAEATDEGTVAFFMRSLLSEYGPIQGQVGDIAGFSLAAATNIGDLVRGQIGHNNTQTSTGNATSQQLGAVAADQSIFVGTHILAVSGGSPSLQVIVQSDDDSGFASPTDRITFSAANAVGSQYASLAGAITDDWWRIRFVISGTSPSFQFVTSFGIQ